MEALVQMGVGGMVGFGIVLFLIAVIFFVKRYMHICAPNEILIISGKTRTMADGSSVGFRVTTGGRTFQIPILETVDKMDVRTIPVEISVTNAYSKGGIPLSVMAIANVKISTDPRYTNNAIERFLGRHRDELRRVAKETLEGNLRGVLANLTPEEVNEDRLKFAAALASDVEDDLQRLGLHLDTLKIQNVSDQVEYLDSIGREQIAIIRRDAEIAESNAKREADQVEAQAKGEGSVAAEEAKALIQTKRNQLRQIKADLEATAKSEEERTVAAAHAARAEAEQELQQVRSQLENLRLQADVVLPSEAAKQAEQAVATGQAATIRERGHAMAQAQAQLLAAFREAGDHAMDIVLMQQIERLVAQVAASVDQVNVGKASLIDGGDGKALAAYVAAYPAIVTRVMEEIKAGIGVDIHGSLTGTREPSHGAVTVSRKTQPTARVQR